MVSDATSLRARLAALMPSASAAVDALGWVPAIDNDELFALADTSQADPFAPNLVVDLIQTGGSFDHLLTAGSTAVVFASEVPSSPSAGAMVLLVERGDHEPLVQTVIWSPTMADPGHWRFRALLSGPSSRWSGLVQVADQLRAAFLEGGDRG